MDADGPPTPRVPPDAPSPAATAGATRTSAARPQHTPLHVPNWTTIPRPRDSSIRLRRLTTSSQTSDLLQAANDRHGDYDAHGASDFAPSTIRSNAGGDERSRHDTYFTQAPGTSASTAAMPGAMTNAAVINLRAEEPSTPGTPSDNGDRFDHRRQRMMKFGRRPSRSITSGTTAGGSEMMEQQYEMGHQNSKRRSLRSSLPLHDESDYDADIVDILDVLDPGVSTMSSLTNVQNSLFIPSLGRFVNRRPTFTLTPYPRAPGTPSTQDEEFDESPVDTSIAGFEKDEHNSPLARRGTISSTEKESADPLRTQLERMPSVLTDDHFAVRPSGTSLATWSDEELADLDDYVRHMLHSRRSKVGRRFRAFGQYVRTPMGFFVTLYGTSILFLGTAWIVFLIGWVSLGNEAEQSAAIHWTNVGLVTLCCLIGICLAPWRAVDTYHLIYIVRLERLAQRQSPAAAGLATEADTETSATTPQTIRFVAGHADGVRGQPIIRDVEAGHDRKSNSMEDPTVAGLSSQQRASLEHHQACFAKSHTFYKPRESETHQAFPLRLLIAIVVLLDSNSVLQLALALCTWTIPSRSRSLALTISLLCCGMGCNVASGILISIGDKRTRKKEAVERMWRQQLTAEAINRKEGKRAKAEKKAQKKLEIEEEERKRRLQQLERIKEEEDGGNGRTSSQWLRKSLDVVRGREVVTFTNSDRMAAR